MAKPAAQTLTELADTMDRDRARTKATGLGTPNHLAWMRGFAQGLRAAAAILRTAADRA